MGQLARKVDWNTIDFHGNPIKEFNVKGVIRYSRMSFWILRPNQLFIAKRLVHYLGTHYDNWTKYRKWLRCANVAGFISVCINNEMNELVEKFKNGKLPPDQELPREIYYTLKTRMNRHVFTTTKKNGESIPYIMRWCTPLKVRWILHVFFPLYVNKRNPMLNAFSPIKNNGSMSAYKRNTELFRLTKLGRKLCGLPEKRPEPEESDELQRSDTENQADREGKQL